MKTRVSWKEWAAILLILGVGTAILLPGLARSREAARRASCPNNLKQIGLICKMFAAESKKGLFPPLSPIPGNWMIGMNAIYPEYATDLRIFFCPSSPFAREDTFKLRNTFEHPSSNVGDLHPDCVSCMFYTYTGYNLMSDEQAYALYEAYEQGDPAFCQMADVEAAVPVWPDSEPPAMGVEGMPIMWDRVPAFDSEFSHAPAGINVLHHNGSVQFVRYSAHNASHNFPATRLTGLTFGSSVPALSRDCY